MFEGEKSIALQKLQDSPCLCVNLSPLQSLAQVLSTLCLHLMFAMQAHGCAGSAETSQDVAGHATSGKA